VVVAGRFEIGGHFFVLGKPLGWRAEDIATSFCLNNDVSTFILITFLGQRKCKHHIPPRVFLDGSKSSKAQIEEGLVFEARHEPFCTVLLEQVSEPIGGVQIEEKECY